MAIKCSQYQFTHSQNHAIRIQSALTFMSTILAPLHFFTCQPCNTNPLIPFSQQNNISRLTYGHAICVGRILHFSKFLHFSSHFQLLHMCNDYSTSHHKSSQHNTSNSPWPNAPYHFHANFSFIFLT